MKKFVLGLLLSVSILRTDAQAVKYYLSASAFQPWGTNTNINAMNQAFGAGNWIQAYYPSVNVNALLQPSVCLIFMEGGDSHANALNAFLIANLPAIQTWVSNGGRLLINAAPNQGANINYGFGGMMLNYAFGPYSASGNAAPGQTGHPIFNGPALPCGTAYTGNWWCHGYVTGPGATQLVVGTTPGCSLCEKPWGSGWAMFGSMTTPNWHAPLANAANFLSNVLTYLAVCCQQPTITAVASPSSICTGQSSTITASGAGVGGTYTINPGNLAGPVVVVSPSVTTIYTVAGTNTTGCVGNTTVQVVVNPLPNITAVANPTAVCLQGQTTSTLTFNGGVSYTMQPGNFFGNTAVVSPASPSTYTVTGVSAAGCVNTGTVFVGINPPASPSALSASVCQGGNLQLSAGGGTAYAWTGPNGFTANVQSPVIPNAQPNQSGFYSVIVTSSLGCTASTVAIANVVPSPTASISHNAQIGGICVGGTLSLLGNAPIGASFSWMGPNGFNNASPNPTVGPVSMLSAGVYSLYINVNTCTNVATTPVIVHALPNVVLANNSPVCLYQPITFTAGGAVNYTVVGPGGFTSYNPNVIIPMASNITAGVYTVTGEDMFGCKNLATSVVNLNQLPVLSAIGSTVCLNSTASLSVTGAASYTWTGPNGFQSTTSSTLIPMADLSVAGNYTVIGVDANGCTSASVANIAVNPLPTPTALASSPVCAGKEAHFTSGDPVGAATTFFWSGPNGFFVQDQNPTISQTETNMSGLYTLTASDANGCKGVYYVNLIVNPLPTGVVVSPNNKGCMPLCSSFSVQSNASLSDILWEVGGNGNFGSGTTASNCFANAGTYAVKAQFTDQFGCTNKSAGFEVNVYPLPQADFNIAPGKPVVDEEIELTDASQGAIVKEWVWNFTNQKSNVSMLQNPRVSYEVAGAYPVALIVRSDKGCLDTIVKTITVGEDFNLYVPNAFTPNGDGVNDIFQPKGFGIVKYELSVFNRWGEKIYGTHDFTQGWDGSYKGKDMVAEGIYVWKIQVINVFGKSLEYKGTVSLTK